MTDRTPQYIPAILDRQSHNRCSAGWLSAQVRQLRAEIRAGGLDVADICMRLTEILEGKEPQ